MKKRFLAVLLAISTAAISATVLTACSKAYSEADSNGDEVTEPVKTREEALEAEIKEAYYNLNKEEFDNYSHTADDIKITFYGKYGSLDQDNEYTESYAVLIDGGLHMYTDALNPVTIDGVVIPYGGGHELDVFNSGDFYTVQEAFDKGLLYHRDLLKIAYRVEHPELLAIESEMQKAYYDIHKKELDRNSCAVDDIKIRFYGKYGESYPAFITSIYAYPQAIHPVTIDGVVLNYVDYQELDVYNNGDFYTVQEAFDKGLLTHDDLVDIAYYLDTFGRFLEH